LVAHHQGCILRGHAIISTKSKSAVPFFICSAISPAFLSPEATATFISFPAIFNVAFFIPLFSSYFFKFYLF